MDDGELTAMAAGEPGPVDAGWALRELQAAVNELNAARRARWQKNAAARRRGIETWLAGRAALGITDIPPLPSWASSRRR